jgi:hypothetical protein
MDTLNHLFATLGRMLLWIASALVLEELTFAGLARLLLSLTSDYYRSRLADTTQSHATRSTATQGEASCSQ